MVYYEIIANRIASLCKRRKYSISKLARLSNVSQSTLDNIMHGRSKNPGVQTLHKVALTFNMTLSEFLDFPELNDYSFDDDTDDDFFEE